MTPKSAKQQYNLRRDLLIAAGQWHPLVDAEPARAHVNHLRDNGLGIKHIAHLAGVSNPVVQRLIYGRPSTGGPPTRRLRPDIAAKLLAVQPGLNTLATSALVDATGTRRRSQALVCLGWSQREQAHRIGADYRSFTGINTSDQVTAHTARAVRALYEELSMTVAPPGHSATCARAVAKRCRYAPPLAWDDDTIDDPNTQPDLGETVPRGDALLENTLELMGQGYTINQTAARLHVGRSYIEKLLRRAELAA